MGARLGARSVSSVPGLADRERETDARGLHHLGSGWPIDLRRNSKEGKEGAARSAWRSCERRPGGDRFNVYVADRFVLSQLTLPQISEISAGALSFDSLVKEYNHNHLAFRVHETATDTEAKDIEKTIKAGNWPAGKPFLNPSKPC